MKKFKNVKVLIERRIATFTEENNILFNKLKQNEYFFSEPSHKNEASTDMILY